jgi:class 3 adenylate cyclase
VRPALAHFAALALLAAGIAALELTAPLDQRLLDLQFKALRKWFPREARSEVAVVGIDEATAAEFSEPIALWHSHLARFLDAMALARPGAVGIDLVLPDRSYETVLPGSDAVLARALINARRGFPLVLALTADPAGRPRPIFAPFAGAVGGDGIGYALFPADRDGAIRRYDESLGEGATPVPILAGQMARRLGIEPRAGYIDFSRGAAFGYVGLNDVVRWAAAGERERLERAFRGKPVLLGTVLPFTDRHVAPVQLAAWETQAGDIPGVLLHAQALRNMLDGGLLEPLPRALTVLAAAAAALLWFFCAGAWRVLALFCGTALAALAGAGVLLAQGWVAPAAPVVLSAALALGWRHALEMRAQLRERRRLRESFAGYVSPAVLEEILAGRIRPETAGVRRFVCVMFADIRGFTARSERMSPEAVIRFLNRYFSRVVALIHERGGTVVSIMGDGMMAVFGTPKPLGDPCGAAFGAGREMLRYVADLNRELRAEGEEPIDIGIGLNAGEALVGHVGSAARHEYSAIGDVTNVAARLQGLSAEHGFRMLVSKAVAERLAEREALAPLGPVAVKGHSPVELYGCDPLPGAIVGER